MKKSFILIASLIALSCQNQNFQQMDTADTPTTDPLNANVIYGTDGRLDYYQTTDLLRRLADSTVALVKTNQLISQSGAVAVSGKNYGQEMMLCSTEKFKEQNTAAFCSGSLVAPDTIITAGHCITNQSDCNETSFVFGFAIKSAGVLPSQVASTEVYRCKSIVKQVLTSAAADFAVIKLDRAVTNHQPLSIRRSGEVQVNDPLVVIGHPSGLPTKITTGGIVRSIANSDYFVANTDTYGGNSGSAVFNANTGLIEGILVRGEQDFTPRGNCYVSNVCQDNSCRGEDITRVALVAGYIPVNTPTPNPQPQPTPPSPPDTPASGPELYTATVNLAIPDNNTTGVNSSLQVKSAPKGRKIFVSVNITHTYKGDLVVKLQTPNGQVITLHNRVGGSADNIQQTYDLTASLKDLNTSGLFKLTVQDLASQDIGKLNSWSIKYE